jgi:uncharacterized membrane protein YfcA
LAGALSGLFGGLVGNQGGIRSAALLRVGLSTEVLVATATATALLVDAVRLPIYLATRGSELVQVWPLLLVLTAGVVVGTFVGVPILKTMRDELFRRLLALLLVALGVSLIVSTAIPPLS